jgi:hypothetical protein
MIYEDLFFHVPILVPIPCIPDLNRDTVGCQKQKQKIQGQNFNTPAGVELAHAGQCPPI